MNSAGPIAQQVKRRAGIVPARRCGPEVRASGMNLLVLGKRRPQGRDLFLSPYGRFYHLPCQLGARGHRVTLLLLDRQRSARASRREPCLTAESVSLWSRGPLGYGRVALAAVRAQSPDWIVGVSDLWFGLFAVWLARRCGARALIDAYDNFESYYPLPAPIRQFWHRALRQADRVTAAGPVLARRLRAAGARSVAVVPMAADPEFYPRERHVCRRQLGLPLDAPLLGHLGSLDAWRDAALLFAAYRQLKREIPALRLVLTGRAAPDTPLPPETLWLGQRPALEIPSILNSLDVACVVNRPGPFGDYSHPIKLYEAMRCQVPVVASALPSTAWILRAHPQCLATPGDVEDFSTRVRTALTLGRWDYGRLPEWPELARRLDCLLR